tara:strand:- start:32 stop:778 length:747 start_codon:yes stop_codon:yes gene_type:complete
MKFFDLLKFKVFKFFLKKYERAFNSFYKNKLNLKLVKLQKNGLNINTIYDIGAYRGEWSLDLSKKSLKGKEFILFEANENNEKYLKNKNFNYFIEVLSDKKKQIKFYSKEHVGDSYYIEQTNFYDDVKERLVDANTLDFIVENEKLKLPDFIKIDTQGSEIDILKGSPKALLNCKLIYLECPIIEYNLGSPNFYEYIKYLNSIDYLPYEICELHYIDEVLVQVDLLFIRKKYLKLINNKDKILKILSN